MRTIILLCASLFTMALLISASPVRAQSVLWVSATGNDANACSQTAPCATFQGAINKSIDVVQINCLGSGNYGAFGVTASITIDCGAGNVGNIVVSTNNYGVWIHTTTAANIVLRHLSLNGLGIGAAGIGVTGLASGTVIVEDCVIQGFANGDGIDFTTSNGRGLLQVSNTQITNNGFGIVVSPQNGQIETVTLNRVELAGNANTGLDLTVGVGDSGVVAGTMRDSVVGANAIGVAAQATQVFFTIEETSVVANPNIGILTASAGSNINVTASTISSNGTGVSASTGNIISFGNNTLNANGSNGNFTGTTALR